MRSLPHDPARHVHMEAQDGIAHEASSHRSPMSQRRRVHWFRRSSLSTHVSPATRLYL